MDNNHTYREIESQIDSWKDVYEGIAGPGPGTDPGFLSGDYDKIVFFGCGTSYNLAMAASFFTNTVSNFDSIAVPSAELYLSRETYIDSSKKYLLVGFSRSGGTTETIEVMEEYKGEKNINTFAFTCRDKNSLIDVSGGHYVCKKAFEKSVAMTKSFSSMLFAYCIILTKFLGNTATLDEFGKLCDYLGSRTKVLFNDVKDYIDRKDFNSYFALGSGFNYAMAVEADLKMKEMSQIPAYSYHIFEFNHGPKALLREDFLCLFLTIGKRLKGIGIILNEIMKQKSKIVIIGDADIDPGIKNNIEFFMPDADFKDELVRSFINIPVFQVFAYAKTIKNKLDPDKPKGLDYTTKLDSKAQ